VLVYVADAGNDRVQEFSRDSRNLIFENEFGWDELSYPSGVAVGRSYIYVSDTDNDRVVAYDRDSLDFVFEFGTRGSGDRQFRGPQGLAYDTEYDELYVADAGNSRIMAFDEEGYYLFKWGTLGTGDLQFDRPRSVAAYNRIVYVADTGNNRVSKFSIGRS